MFLEQVHINGKLTHMDIFDCKPAGMSESIPTLSAVERLKAFKVKAAMVQECLTKEGKNPMRMEACISDCKSEAEVTRRYLRDRIDEVMSDKKTAAKIKFNLNTVEPKSPAELVTWIKEGKFTFNPKCVDANGEWLDNEDLLWWRNAYGAIDFRQAPADKKGYDAWKVQMEAARQSALDEIRTLSAEKGLEALRKFEAFEVQ